MRTRYTYGCCIGQEVNKNYVKLERVIPALTAYFIEVDWKEMQEAIPIHQKVSANMFLTQRNLSARTTGSNIIASTALTSWHTYPCVKWWIHSFQSSQEQREIRRTWKQFDQARKNSPVMSIGGIKNGSPTAVEQNSISICFTRNVSSVTEEKPLHHLETCAPKVPSAIHPIKVLYEDVKGQDIFHLRVHDKPKKSCCN